MIQRKPILRTVGSICFSIAVILGILLTIARALPDLEATMYGFIRYGYPPIRTLHCPVLMTSIDSEPVTIRLHNPLDINVTWYVQEQLSSPVLILTTEETVGLQPGETRTLSWEVGKDNIDQYSFIYAHVLTSASAGLNMNESTCGTFVLHLPITGGPVIYYAGLFLTVLSGAFGLWLWMRHREMGDPAVNSQSWWMRILSIVITVGLVASIFDLWFLAILMLALTLLALSAFLITP